MRKLQNTIAPDHQQKLVEVFELVYYLIDNDKLPEAVAHLLELHCADLADFLDNSNIKIYQLILPIIADKMDPETLVWLSDSNKQQAIESLGIKKSAQLINQLNIEDSIEVIDALEEVLQEKLIFKLKSDKKQQILEGFKYPEDTVGRILEKKFLVFQDDWSVDQALQYICSTDFDENTYSAIIVNNKYQPVGIILLSALIKHSSKEPLTKLMNKDLKVADVFTKITEIAFLFKQYAQSTVPVVNKAGRLIGIVSIHNMLYIIEDQTESEFMHLGGINTSDIFDNLYDTVKRRFPWLFINLITACITSLVINEFSATIERLITLATIMPIVASLGGNAGTQVMTVTVRALINREITQTNNLKVILKETVVCLLNGFSIALIGALLIYILFGDADLSLIFTAAVIINFTIAGTMGSAIPIIIDSLDIDPATASGVMLTTITDALGFFSFLGLAFFFII